MTAKPDEIKSKARNYLTALGYSVTEKSHEGMTWVLIAQRNDGTGGAAVARWIASQDRIAVQGAYGIEPFFTNGYDRLDPEQKREMLYEIRTGLLMLGAPYERVEDQLREVHFLAL